MNGNKNLWEKCVEFHGHECGGLAIGYQAALYASELLNVDFSKDEELVCVTENDACGVDAIQIILGCSAGKGNLIFKIRGKQAFSFYNRKSGKSVRLVMKSISQEIKDRMQYLIKTDKAELFDVKETIFELPEEAKIFHSIACEKCGEMTAESMIRLQDGKQVCMDCYEDYKRFY